MYIYKLSYRVKTFPFPLTSNASEVCQAAATAKAPVINQRQSSTFDLFQPVTDRTGALLLCRQSLTVDQVIKLLSKAPTKHSQLHPIPTWLVKQSAKQFAVLHRFLPPCATHLSKAGDSCSQWNMPWSLLA